jgi:hypothetical protein
LYRSASLNAAIAKQRSAGSLFRLILGLYGPTILTFFLLFLVAEVDGFLVCFATIFALVPLLQEFAIPPLALLNKSFREDLGLKGARAHLEYFGQSIITVRTEAVDINWKQTNRVAIYIVIVLVAVAASKLEGYRQAKGRTVFPFLGGTAEVILRRYGDSFVIGRIDQDSGKLLSEFRLVKADDMKDKIIMKNVGKLVPMAIKREDVRHWKKPANAPPPVLPTVAPAGSLPASA